MKKELDFFRDGRAYGGNQDWFTNIVMNMGGRSYDEAWRMRGRYRM